MAAADASAVPARLASPKPQRAFETIIASLRELMASGQLRPGDRLPAERDLAEQFGVSRTSVREALRVLESLGVITVRRGAEHGATLSAAPSNAFSTTFGLLMDLRHISPAELLEFRLMLELGAARSVAAKGDPEALDRLRAITHEMEAETTSDAEFYRLDGAFHVALLEAAGNRLVDLVEAGIDSALRRIITEAAMSWREQSSLRSELMRQHREIVVALEVGDGDEAARLLSDHIQQWGSRLV